MHLQTEKRSMIWMHIVDNKLGEGFAVVVSVCLWVGVFQRRRCC